MRYRLRTLLIFVGIVPPVSALLCLHWYDLLTIATICTLLGIWFWASLSMARFCGWIVASLMG